MLITKIRAVHLAYDDNVEIRDEFYFVLDFSDGSSQKAESSERQFAVGKAMLSALYFDENYIEEKEEKIENGKKISLVLKVPVVDQREITNLFKDI